MASLNKVNSILFQNVRNTWSQTESENRSTQLNPLIYQMLPVQASPASPPSFYLSYFVLLVADPLAERQLSIQYGFDT